MTMARRERRIIVRIKFYLDEKLPTAIAVLLRSLGLDAVGAHEVRTNGLPDDEQFAFAIAHERCIVTKDKADFQRLAVQRDAEGARHFGIIILSRAVNVVPANYARIARRLAQYADLYPEGMEHTGWINLPRLP